jgi:hypothetical protein
MTMQHQEWVRRYYRLGELVTRAFNLRGRWRRQAQGGSENGLALERLYNERIARLMLAIHTHCRVEH